MPIATKMGARLKFLIEFFGIRFLVSEAIVKSKHADPLIVKVGQNDWREGTMGRVGRGGAAK